MRNNIFSSCTDNFCELDAYCEIIETSNHEHIVGQYFGNFEKPSYYYVNPHCYFRQLYNFDRENLIIHELFIREIALQGIQLFIPQYIASYKVIDNIPDALYFGIPEEYAREGISKITFNEGAKINEAIGNNDIRALNKLCLFDELEIPEPMYEFGLFSDVVTVMDVLDLTGSGLKATVKYDGSIVELHI